MGVKLATYGAAARNHDRSYRKIDFASSTDEHVGMPYAIRTEQVKAVPIAVVRRRAGHSEFSRVVPEACGTVWSGLKGAGVKGGRHVAIYRQLPDGQFDLEIGAEVDTAFAGKGEVVGSTLPAGEVATTTHFGPYQQLGGAHQAVQAWCAANKRTPVESWEIYGHWVDEWNKDPSKIRTDVFYLLKS
jgi:effector-binding domain-containing protein